MQEYYIPGGRVARVGHQGKCILRAMETSDLRPCRVALLKDIVLSIGYLIVVELSRLR